jgi:hypothetical protein
MTYVQNYSIRRAYWATQETISDWVPSATNTAGSLDFATDGEFVCGKPTRGQTLLWTTRDLWTMTYIGGEFIYSIARVGDNCGIISKRAAVVIDTGAYWMGFGKFFIYDGFVKPIPCDVNDYVFLDFNTTTASTIFAIPNPRFGEVTWYYPATGAASPNRYVTYNYIEKHWVFGVLSRAAGVAVQAGAVNPVPVLIDANGNIYDHETGSARSGSVFIESGPIELDAGDNVIRVQQIVPDDASLGDVSMSLYTSLFPDQSETLNGPYTLANPTSVRLTARQVRIRITEVLANAWQVGVVRLGGIRGGRR